MSDKTKYEMEFPIHASPSLLFQYISTPSGMQEWYADNVNSRGEFFDVYLGRCRRKSHIAVQKQGTRPIRFQVG